ncbi:MAG: hypothetical protein ACI4VF_02065 [Lachnospirales bacterium]
MEKSKRKSHKVLIVLGVIFCLLIVAVCVFCFIQRDNIGAVMTSVKYSKDDIKQQIDESKGDVEKSLNEYNISNLRDFTFEEEEQIRRGQITYEEALRRIMEESGVADKITVASDGNSDDSANGSKAPGVPQVAASSNEPDAIVSEYAIKLYGVKAYYLGEIGNLVDQAKAEHKAGKSLKSLASEYIGKAASLEKEADSGVNSLLSELKSKLDAVGADTSVIDTMKSAYINEKNLKKSYYLSLYQSKG